MRKGTKKAVALEYDGSEAPSVIASAQGKLAEKIIEIARMHNVPLYEDADLAEALSLLKVGEKIPENLFKAVAEVFGYCYWINEKLKNKLDATF
ncbi:MAG: EscU/YscU/HrcU family type III secretion system export apparatus switch protein [Spirochaetes bacterium]|nr:EscU/YscU/HrcU family type III secretion system export apparatus switch protein [Spirochaetota bacterium]